MIDTEGQALSPTSLEGSAKAYRKQPALPPVQDTEVRNGELCAIFDGEWKECRYLQKLIYMKDSRPDPEDIRRFVELFDYCVDKGLLGYGQLAPFCMLPLAKLDTGPGRALLIVYAFSDYTIEELNARLGSEVFVQEGVLIEDADWPELK